MEFFRKNVDELSRLTQESPEQQVGFLWSLLRFLFIVLLLLALAFVGLRFGYTPFLRAQIEAREAAIADLGSRIPEGEREELLGFALQLADLQEILRRHTASSKALALLEARTNARVQLTAFSFDVRERKATLEGLAPSYEVVTEQLKAFEETGEIERATLGEAEREREGRVRWSATLTFSPRLLAP